MVIGVSDICDVEPVMADAEAVSLDELDDLDGPAAGGVVVAVGQRPCSLKLTAAERFYAKPGMRT